MFKGDKYVGSCNTLNKLSNRVCAPNKTEDLDVHVFNMIIEKNESKALIKYISYKCECTFDGKNVVQINGGITINVDVSAKNFMYLKKIIFGICYM